MPLMNSKSPKAFEHNMKAEMKAGKPRAQSLAIAYAQKRKAPKAKGGMIEASDMKSRSNEKPIMAMAKGGEVHTAANERRPMPDMTYEDSSMTNRNRGNKPQDQDNWTDQPTIAQAGRAKVVRKSAPRMVESSVMNTKLRNQEADLQDMSRDKSAPSMYDEEGPDRQGTSVPDMQDEHSTKRKPYAEGGSINHVVSFDQSEEDAKEHPAGLEEDDDQMRPEGYMDEHDPAMFADGGVLKAIKDTFGAGDPSQNYESPSNLDEGPSRSVGEGATSQQTEDFNSPDKKAIRAKYGMPEGFDSTASGGAYAKAEGGMIEDIHDMDDVPEEEYDLDHDASMAAAIMSRMDMKGSSDSDIDQEQNKTGDREDDVQRQMMFEGGEIEPESDGEVELDTNNEEIPNSYYHRNEVSALKENYDKDMDDLEQPEDSNLKSPEHDPMDVNDDDIIRSIRRKMKPSPMTR